MTETAYCICPPTGPGSSYACLYSEAEGLRRACEHCRQSGGCPECEVGCPECEVRCLVSGCAEPVVAVLAPDYPACEEHRRTLTSPAYGWREVPKAAPSWEIRQGDVLTRLREMPDESVSCVVTSPPYWGLRDYGVEGQLGLEATTEAYVENMVAVFREVRRVLRKDGTCWVNMGDSYANDEKWGGATGGKHVSALHGKSGVGRGRRDTGLKPKDLVGMPWRLAFALQADGWWLRSDIIWSKPNPMPESVTDRPTKAHEYLFLLTKGEWSSRVIKLANLTGEYFHFSENFRAQNPHSGTVELCIRLATAIFDGTQGQEQISLPPFYSEVWKQLPDGSDSDFVRAMPDHQRAAVFALRFLHSQSSTQEFLSQFKGLGIALADGQNFLIRGIAAPLPLPPSIYRDGDATVAVNHSGQICKFDFPHEAIVLLKPSTCSYWYDAEAIREDAAFPNQPRWGRDPKYVGDQTKKARALESYVSTAHRNARTVWEIDEDEFAQFLAWKATQEYSPDVWTIATEAFRGAHFATFPTELVRRCVLAGCPEWVCATCQKPRTRVVEATPEYAALKAGRSGYRRSDLEQYGLTRGSSNPSVSAANVTLGWSDCGHGNFGPGVVLDPFAGSGTTVMVALRLNRSAIGIELSPEYVAMARERIRDDAPLLVSVLTPETPPQQAALL